MLKIEKVDHIAVIASDLTASLAFYCDVLGFTVLSEHYRAERRVSAGAFYLSGKPGAGITAGSLRSAPSGICSAGSDRMGNTPETTRRPL